MMGKSVAEQAKESQADYYRRLRVEMLKLISDNKKITAVKEEK